MRANCHLNLVETKDQHYPGCSKAFCNVPIAVPEALVMCGRAVCYPVGARLFVEGELSEGAFLLSSGRAKLTISSRNGKSLMRICSPGEILGLSATLSGDAYEASAEMLDNGRVGFVERQIFMELVQREAMVSLYVAQLLSREYQAVHEQVRTLALSDSVAEKMARLLLDWCRSQGKVTAQGTHLKVSLTHNEIAQMIGVTRETVTRLLSEFKNRQIIQLNGSSLIISDRAALESIVN
jgi:CRP/FNR family transcriptional regulator, cyclic AMP receptor protein